MPSRPSLEMVVMPNRCLPNATAAVRQFINRPPGDSKEKSKDADRDCRREGASADPAKILLRVQKRR